MTPENQPQDTIAPALPGPDIELANAPTMAPPKTDDAYLVDFAPAHDPDNPFDWRTGKKWAVTDVLSATGFNRIMVSTIMAPALPTIAREFGLNSAEAVMVLSIYPLATALGPMIIGPLSEVYGRKPILHFSNVWFLVWNLACGFANSGGLLIACRFMAGFGASAIYALAGGVLGDMWRPEQRGKSLGVYLLIPVLGAAVGPIIGGFIASRSDWRWCFWATSAFQAAMMLASYTSFHETYAPVILKRRAQRKRRETGNQRYYAACEKLDAGKSPFTAVGRALSRPLRLLATHPLIQLSSVISAFNYGLLYLVLATFAELWMDKYDQRVEISGLHYIACALGEVIGTLIGGPLLDYFYRRAARRKPNGEAPDPEHRIPLMLIGLAIAPIGFFIYGWTAQYRVHWLAVDVGVLIALLGGQIAGMPISAYIIDVYTEHTSSATGATQLLRSLAAFGFPLFAPTLYSALGYGWANSLLGFLGLFIGIPTPLFIWLYGKKLRAKLGTTY